MDSDLSPKGLISPWFFANAYVARRLDRPAPRVWLHQMNGVHVQDEIAAWDTLAFREQQQLTKHLTQCVAAVRLQHEVESVDALQPCNWSRSWPQHTNLI